MALIDHDSIDLVDTAFAAKRGWSFVNGGGSAGVVAAVGRGGSQAIVVTTPNGTDAYAQKSFATSYAAMTWIVGIYVSSLPGPGYEFQFDFLEGGTVHLRLEVDPAGGVSLYRGGTTLLPGISWTLTPATYQVWQFSFEIHDSAGSWSFSVDSVPIASASGVDTRNGGSGVVNACRFLCGGPGGFRIDDLSIFDAVVTHEDFRNEAVMPTADGAHGDWSRSAGSDSFAVVDEIPPAIADYVSTMAAGDKVSFTYPAPAVAGDVRALTFRPLLRCDLAGVRQVRAFIRSGGVDYPHASSFTVGSDDEFAGWTWLTHPVTGVPFDSGDFPIEVGLEVTV